MSQQPQSEPRSPAKPDKTNPASPGRNSEGDDSQHSSTKNLETEPDRARHSRRDEDSSRVDK